MELTTLLLGLPAATTLCFAGVATAQEAAALDEVVVTGSRLAGAPLAPVEMLDRWALTAATTSDSSRLLRLVSANSGSEAQINQLNQPPRSGAAQFNLRSLGRVRPLFWSMACIGPPALWYRWAARPLPISTPLYR